MAKQTFTTGQVLTAAQMTNLQQTAMLGGAGNAKTSSYTLVAADAGDGITMSNAGATTITVNTGLFAAGDIVTIINIGAGVCTITAGTATVTSSGSLALAQNQGGVLRFTSTSAAIFLQFATPASGDIEGVTAGVGISGGGTSGTVTITNSMATAIDAKGDLVAGTGADTFARLAVGSNGTYLQANSATSTGLQWASISTGGMTAISTQSLSGSSTITFSSIPGTYKHLLLTINNWRGSNALYLRSNGNTATYFNSTFGVSTTEFFNSTNLGSTSAAQANFNNVSTWIYEYAQGASYGFKQCDTRAMTCTSGGSYTAADVAGANMNSTGAITSLSIVSGSGNFTDGTATLYGVS